ncbi:beta-lactamase [Klebsiella pneumoniae]|uniref:Beta-lactamase n=1 Tax=Klebsiella pneumoniae TaxID=573 RepID=A0A447S8I5_KLEPN|nr:beta-lactamase [Klebsiella pneumoniae]
MKCCCWAIPRRTCPSLGRYSCSQAAWRPNKAGMPPSSHETNLHHLATTCRRLYLSVPSPPGYATRRSAREVAMSPAPFYTLTAGDLTVTAVSDGLMSAPLSLLSGISREEAEHLQRHSGLASPETIAIGAYLIRGRGNTVLVDTAPAEPMALAANFIANLARLGVGPEEIDAILSHPRPSGPYRRPAVRRWYASVSQRHGVPAYAGKRLLAGNIHVRQRQRSRPAQRAACSPCTGELRGANQRG